MKALDNSIALLAGLKIIKKQWVILSFAFIASAVILGLDFLLTTSMPKVIAGIQSVMAKDEGFNIDSSWIILSSLIALRPAIGWIVNYIQISIMLNILRRLENDIVAEFREIYLTHTENYSSENSANMLISHGRYFVDNFLFPLIRAVTDAGSIIVIAIGLLIQFPIALLCFLFSAVASLTLYQLVCSNLLRENGGITLRSYEAIMKSSKEGFDNIRKISNPGESDSNNHTVIYDVLDKKKKAAIVTGSISQGLKYVVEFCFMVSFGAATVAMFLTSPADFSAFVATFAYAGVRMLPSFTSVISFFQTRSAAEHAVKELLDHLVPKEGKLFTANEMA